jgi:hypothetical protein
MSNVRALAATVAVIAAPLIAACAPAPQIGSPAYCATSTISGSVFGIVGTDCGHGPGHVYTDEICGPLVPSTNYIDQCFRAQLAAIPGRTLMGVVVVRYSTLRLDQGDIIITGLP